MRAFSHEAAADAFFASLVQLDQSLGGAVFRSPLHLIGHSRGTIVTSEIAQRLGLYFPGLPDVHVTTLDPHDFPQPNLDTNISTLVAGSPVPGLLTGTIDPATLRAVVDATGATGTADGAIRDLSVLAGLLALDEATADLGSTAHVGDATAVRGLVIDHLEVLDLTALLEALGLSLGDLPLDVLLDLLDGLGLPLPAGVASLEELTTTLAYRLAL